MCGRGAVEEEEEEKQVFALIPPSTAALRSGSPLRIRVHAGTANPSSGGEGPVTWKEPSGRRHVAGLVEGAAGRVEGKIRRRTSAAPLTANLSPEGGGAESSCRGNGLI